LLKVVADTSIYISAILSAGKPGEIGNLARQGKIELLGSEAILDELAGVFRRKFGWSDWRISEVIENLNAITILVIPKRTLKVIKAHKSNKSPEFFHAESSLFDDLCQSGFLNWDVGWHCELKQPPSGFLLKTDMAAPLSYYHKPRPL
jgi:putative PIN family toxin of toxin-antitoxin system